MVGLTEEIRTVSEAIEKIYKYTVTTYGTGPTHIILGGAEIDRLRVEAGGERKAYWGVPIVRSLRPGVDVGLPLAS